MNLSIPKMKSPTSNYKSAISNMKLPICNLKLLLPKLVALISSLAVLPAKMNLLHYDLDTIVSLHILRHAMSIVMLVVFVTA